MSLSAYTDYGKFGYDKTGITFETGKYYAIGVKMESRAMDKSLTEVTASEIGWRIGSDGMAYEPTDNLPSGESRGYDWLNQRDRPRPGHRIEQLAE